MADEWAFFLDLAYRTFGKYLENSSLTRDFQIDLVHASISITAEEYLSAALLAALIVPVIFVPLIFIILFVFGIPIALGIIIIPLVWLMFGGLTFMGFYVYPTIKIEEAKKSAANSLPFAAIYLSTLAGAGMPITHMMEIMCGFKEYGEIAIQSSGIIRDIEILGYDISGALERAAARTPSPELKELFWGINTTTLSGGDLKTFLVEKAKNYMSIYRRSLDMYVEQLSLLTEIYITAVVVGSIFFIVMTTIMNMIGVTGTSLALIQNLVVYLLLPLVSIGFMVIVAATSPV